MLLTTLHGSSFVLKLLPYCRNKSAAFQNCRWLHFKPSTPLVRHLIKNHYIKAPALNIHCETDGNINFELDILGNVLLKNWEAEWRKYLCKSELLTPVAKDFHLTLTRSSANLVDEILEQLDLPLAPNKGIAIAGTITGHNSKTKRMLVVARNQMPSGEHHDIQFEQLRLLKNFFNKPSRIKVASGKHGGRSQEHHSVQYETDSDHYCIQDIRKYSNGENSMFCGTIFLIDMEQLFSATMVDAYGTRNRHGYLKLHPRLSPIKVLVLPDSVSTPDNLELVEEICAMLRSWNIVCWNCLKKNIAGTDVDELGAPFAIILPSTMRETGLLHLRNSRTTIKMEVHISHLAQTLMRNLNFTY